MTTINEQSPIVCIESNCGRTFQLASGEVEFYVQREFELPKRCQPCRSARKNGTPTTYAPPATQVHNYEINNIICSNCGRDATVPFRPLPNKNVYCKICWEGVKNIVSVPSFQ